MTDQPMDIPDLEQLTILEYGTEVDLVAAAIAVVQARMPEWEPRDGNVEVALFEGFAMMLGVDIMSSNNVHTALVDQLMSLRGLPRSEGAPARVRVQITVTNSEPIQVIPAGTRLRYQLEESEETVDFLTAEDLNIVTSTSLTGQVETFADEVGIEGNGIPASAVLEVVDSLSFVDFARTAQKSYGGRGEESDDSYNRRASAALALDNTALALPEQFSAATMLDPDIGRVLTLDRFRAESDPQFPHAGYVTVAVADHDGLPLSTEKMEALAVRLLAQSLASLRIRVIGPTYNTFNMAVTVRPARGFTDDEVKNAVETELRGWLSPARWNWDRTVNPNAVIGMLSKLDEVDYVITPPAAITLLGAAPLPDLQTVTVTLALS